MLKIYHNSRCMKSRKALEIINDTGKEVEVIEYLKNIPSASDLKEILKKLKLKPEQLIRKDETVYKDSFAGKNFTDEEWIQIMVENPILIERPIVINGDKAVIGRPPENVKNIL